MSKRKTQKDFEQELYIINPNIKVIGKYRNSNTKINCKCKIDNYEWDAFPNNLIRGNGCPVCSNHKVMIGINDMWTTAPEQAKLLANSEDGYKYTQCSDKKVDWKCPQCGNIIKNKSIAKVYYRGLFCPYCSDGISYPERFMYNLLFQLDVNFEYQKKFEWCKYIYKTKQHYGLYDFYLQDYNLIIETDGSLGHGNDNKMTGQLAEESIYIDNIKDNLAEKHGIKLIRIDCQYNNQQKFEYIKNNVILKLSMIFDLSNVNWNNIDKISQNSIMIKVCNYKKLNQNMSTTEIGKIFHLNRTTIREYLKRGSILNLCHYNSEEAKQDNYKNNGIRISKMRSIKVICITIHRIFNSISEAENVMKVKHICDCCNHKRNSAGKLLDGTPLVWMYYNEYIKLHNSKIAEAM